LGGRKRRRQAGRRGVGKSEKKPKRTNKGRIMNTQLKRKGLRIWKEI